MLRIAITEPGFRTKEAEEITNLLESGLFDRVHIRKPEWSIAQVRKLLKEIPENFHPLLSLHQFPELIGESPGCYRVGFHENSRCPVAPEEALTVSRSCHSIEEAVEASLDPRISYQFLSPVFDSISKNGYLSAFDPEDLEELPPMTVALGGVTPGKFPLLENFGFAGGAMLGYVWMNYNSLPGLLK